MLAKKFKRIKIKWEKEKSKKLVALNKLMNKQYNNLIFILKFIIIFINVKY